MMTYDYFCLIMCQHWNRATLDEVHTRSPKAQPWEIRRSIPITVNHSIIWQPPSCLVQFYEMQERPFFKVAPVHTSDNRNTRLSSAVAGIWEESLIYIFWVLIILRQSAWRPGDPRKSTCCHIWTLALVEDRPMTLLTIAGTRIDLFMVPRNSYSCVISEQSGRAHPKGRTERDHVSRSARLICFFQCVTKHGHYWYPYHTVSSSQLPFMLASDSMTLSTQVSFNAEHFRKPMVRTTTSLLKIPKYYSYMESCDC